jgi:hypothetical protein
LIVNHRYRFIFLKTKKTAGTSIEIALSRYCEANDILSKIGRRDEPKRAALGYQGPANYLEPGDGSLRSRIDRWLHGPKERYSNHMPALEIREKLGRESWDSYYKFCFERNPWDRAISAYFWENRSKRRIPDFEKYLETLEREGNLSNWPQYTIEGRIAVDEVLFYEDLQAGLRRLVERLGLPGPLELPDAKREYRKDRRPYRELYTDRARDFVARACDKEIEAFGYKF